MFRKVLIANRGEIACRILATLDRLGIGSVAIYSDADSGAPHVRRAAEAVRIGPAPVAESYLLGERILAVARERGADAIHPGYGLLSENARFAAQCEAAGIAFIGPTPGQIEQFGRKDRARELAEAAGLRVAPGSSELHGVEDALAAANACGYPVLLKAIAGGGGIGMRLCRDAAELERNLEAVRRQAQASFGDGGVFVERFVERARHVEVQVFGDGAGGVTVLGERDCSLQRRRQKVFEEAPAAGLDPALRSALEGSARALARSVRYRSAGTVEFLVDPVHKELYFLEVNTRLQVEHGVTEAIAGIDLVEWMVRLAAGDANFLASYAHRPGGHAIEVRLYGEDPARGFQPSAGVLTEVAFPSDVRVDGWVEPGCEVSPFYDPLLAKVIASGPTRDAALARLREALARTRLGGMQTNLRYARAVLDWPEFRADRHHTRSLDDFAFEAREIRVEAPGAATAVQEYPGRVGYWAVGVPPSGPMDALAFRLANRIVGNADGAAALEMAVHGPTLRFALDSLVCVAGAPSQLEIDGAPAPMWRALAVPAGAVLRVGRVGAPGARAYLAVRGALDVPEHLGSRATFTLGGFGGHCGRALAPGDVLPLGDPAGEQVRDAPLDAARAASLAVEYASEWELGVLEGPHAAPDFFTEQDLETFYARDFEVHYQSARTGVRLIGPRPLWAREDGGDAGLHPSNIHDTPYAIGAVDYTGDMPVILGPDGPSLGGFVCPAVVASSELWKLGQLRAGDRVRFRPLSLEAARVRAAALERSIAQRAPLRPDALRAQRPFRSGALERGVVERRGERAGRPALTLRQSGDRYLLVELGPMMLDLDLRVRIELLAQDLTRRIDEGSLRGIVDLTQGVRSLQIHFDPARIPFAELVAVLLASEESLPDGDELSLPTRIVHLPLSWEDPETLRAIEKYRSVVRDEAPWCPSNLEFIRRINGLASLDDVRRIVFDASYLVLGLGDVYLGAPVATPLDPRHRMVTTKYNPARTWTPENAVGIGGAYLCIYGMEGPGGYQLVGRTVPVWSSYQRWTGSARGRPWLLRSFDQIRFFPVSAEELLEQRRLLRDGRGELRIEPGRFELAAHHRFLASIAGGIEAFRGAQRAAFAAERARWVASGELAAAEHIESSLAPAAAELEAEPEPGIELVTAPLGAQVWRISVAPGQRVEAGDELAVLSAMKTETPVVAPCAGVVERIFSSAGRVVAPGAALLSLRTA
jgi:urea carboxylase